ncbi:leucine--tRNA ligase [bacterium]|nr:leucine--tRNA ligase [bacterium]
MDTYNFKEVESKWKKIWEETELYKTDLDDLSKKLYCLVMFIYPSGDRLHIGHWYNYAPTDTWARFKKMQGFNVFEPIGYDAFGLPAENYAIKKGVHPALSTAENIDAIRKQLKDIGAMYDWSKEINTSEPEYYKWTQWLFLQLYKNGLAYKKKAPVNWCPSCKTVLANEQVVEGKCERCNSEVIQKDLEQWFFKITDYADKLLEGLNRIDWPEKTIAMQKNWIGRSEGAWIKFKLSEYEEGIEVFTTRPDTLWGVTYMVLAPEHKLVREITKPEYMNDVESYIKDTGKSSEIERTSTEKEKTGVFTGAFCINPVNGENVPVWIADYVLASYGTGAVMAVPAHDERDFEFAKKYRLPIKEVISPDGNDHDELDGAYTENGIMINSGPFSGVDSKSGKKQVIEYLDEKGWGGARINYKLRDWLISRQRYWGAPIPVILCDSCGTVPVPEKDIPIILPEEVQFKEGGESPLLTNKEWVKTKCPVCGREARREVDTMDTFVCSSWYYLRYPTPQLSDKPFDKEIVSKWLPVDQYVGGAEHAVMHLMYARFITKVLYDLKLINFDEPFSRLIHQGVITNNGAKMSKSRGNVINPDIYIQKFGSDVFRMYIMFMGSYTDGGDWSDEGIFGIHRFLNRVWRLIRMIKENPPKGNGTNNTEELERVLHNSIKHTTMDLERFHFNTCISRIMELVNYMYLYVQDIDSKDQEKEVLDSAVNNLIKLISPFAPHFGEEMWREIGNRDSIFLSEWPKWDENKIKEQNTTIVVQINGKLRTKFTMPVNSSDDVVRERALSDERVKNYTEGREIKKIIVVKNKLVSIAVA